MAKHTTDSKPLAHTFSPNLDCYYQVLNGPANSSILSHVGYKSVCVCVCVCVCVRVHARTSLCSVSNVSLSATPRTAACHAPQSMGFSRQEYCNGLPFPTPGHLPDPGIPGSKIRLDGSQMWLGFEKSQTVSSWWPGPKGNCILKKRNSGSQLLNTEETAGCPPGSQSLMETYASGHTKQGRVTGMPPSEGLHN